MTLTELIDTLFPSGHPNRPTPAQEDILRHPQGPAWVLAGPGSGKTEVLTLFVLRLLYVENDPAQTERMQPEAIFVTTFTEKATRNLEDRISHYRNQIVAQRPDLITIDISKLRLGTLHGLCNDLLQEHRAPNYQNVRLMDELESSMFVYEHISIVNAPNPTNDRPFWTHFVYVFFPREWQATWAYLPSKWNMTSALVKLFNRIIEDRISVPAMHEQIQSQKQIAESENQGDRNQKEQCIIIPVIEIMSGNYVISRIMDVVKLDMILEKSSAKAAMAEISMK